MTSTHGRPPSVVRTPRLELRPVTEADRGRFVELFCDEAFMVFGDVLTEDAAHDRFDRMLVNCARLAFAKQPVIERSTGVVIGYSGVDWVQFEGRQQLEFGYRLVPEARGLGYATEASRAVFAKAVGTYDGDVLAIIDPVNQASQNVARKLDFALWKQATVDGCLRNIYRRRVASVPAV